MNSLVYCVWALKWKIEWNVPDLLRSSLHLVYVSFGDYISKRNEWHHSTTSAHLSAHISVSLWLRRDCLSCGIICILQRRCVRIYILITACPRHRPNQFLSCFILPRAWLIKILRWSSVAPFLSHVTSCIFKRWERSRSHLGWLSQAIWTSKQ